MKLIGLNIDVVENSSYTKNRSVFSLDSKIFCEPTELCLILFNLLQNPGQVSCVKICFRVYDLDIYTAYDIAIAIEECKKLNIKFIGYSEQLSLSHFLAMCFCNYRICPPLVGKLSFSLNFKHFIINNSDLLFQCVKVGHKKLPLISLTSEKLDESALIKEKELGEEIINKCIAIILRAIPQSSSLKSYYSTAVELAEKKLLSYVCYEEFLTMNIPFLENVKWKYKKIHKIDLTSLFSKLRFRLRKMFFILELNVNYWEELNSLKNLRQQLIILFDSKNTNGLLLIVNYKGGSYESADRIWCLINALKKKFPVYIYIKLAASSGYCIASAGSKIFINPCGYLGNVGTIMFSTNYDNILKHIGIDVINNISSPLLDDISDLKILNSRTEIAFTLFINRIAESRNLKIETVSNLMDGSNFSSDQSVFYKFADKEECLTSILRSIGRSNVNNTDFVFIKRQKSFIRRITNFFLFNFLIKVLFR